MVELEKQAVDSVAKESQVIDDSEQKTSDVLDQPLFKDVEKTLKAEESKTRTLETRTRTRYAASISVIRLALEKIKNDVDLRSELQKRYKMKFNASKPELFAVNVCHRIAGTKPVKQTKSDQVNTLKGMDEAGVGYERQSTIDWLGERENNGKGGEVSGKGRALMYAKRRAANQSSGSEGDRRKTAQATKRSQDFDTYVKPSLVNPLASFALTTDVSGPAEDVCLLLGRRRGAQMDVVEIINARREEVEKLVLSKRAA